LQRIVEADASRYNVTMDVILTHEHTDFDALASLMAAARLHPEAVPILPHQMNRNTREFITLYGDEFEFAEPRSLTRRRIDRALLVDTQNALSLRGMGSHTEVHVVDHHPRSPNLDDSWEFIGDSVGATTTLFVERMVEGGLTITPIEATLFLLGIYEDTGSLSYLSTTVRDMRAAAWLKDQGANLEVLNEFLHHALTPSQQSLFHDLVSGTEAYEYAGRAVTISSAQAKDFADEISTLAHKVGDLFEPDAVFLLVDLGDRIQMVARSSSSSIDVGLVAKAMGGGGHARAAAALLRDCDLSEAEARVTALLKTNVEPAVTVGEIMSHGVQTLSPQTTVAEAAARMQRLGHEGFPVVADGSVVGMLTRSEIDRAQRHDLNDAPIKRYMTHGEVHVTPGDPVERVQSIVRETGWGQVPVVDESSGEIIGIVTRTDLIRLWTTPAPSLDQTATAGLISDLLPEGLLSLLRTAGEVSAGMGFALYAVGGFARDLILGQPTFDVDLVVEGDAARLARHLASLYGGRVRGHKRFGTAKWILDDDQGLPVDSLDFVTSRIEFYEHPTALPKVERSSIRQDLHRRDFTINTLAIRLDPGHWGELLDFYGGERDLKSGRVRVLHSLSFIEDPTRILRAARFEQRFGFRIESRTEELISEAKGLLKRVTGERIRHELYLIMEEDRPEAVFARLQQLRVLDEIGMATDWTDGMSMKFQALRQAAAQEADAELPGLPSLYLALATTGLDREQCQSFMTSMRIVRDDRRLVQAVTALREVEAELAQNSLAPSRVHQLLHQAPDAARLVFGVATDSWLVRQRLQQYTDRLRSVETMVDGSYLRDLGVPGGPVYRQILDNVLQARIDGQVTTLEDEQRLVKKLLQDQHNNTEAAS